MKYPAPITLPLLAIGLALLAGCGGEQKSAGNSVADTAESDGSRVIKITADDTMKYSVTEIVAKPGEKLTIVLTNVGRVPKQAMAHNWVLLKPATEAELNALAMAASQKAPDYLPDDRSAILAHTKVLGPGESDRIEVTAPDAPGEYRFLCTFPGHFVMMKGRLVVK